jgi:hypothetical protein
LKYHIEPINGIPVFFGQLALLFTQERKMSATITYTGLGYQIAVWSSKGPTNFILCAERTKKPRTFKTADSALKVCRSLGVMHASIQM